MKLTPKTRAEKSAQVMWSDDRASAWLGMVLEHVDEGEAILSLTVAREHTNGHGICHGGITYALADSAFAFACNSRNQMTVAQHNTITYIAPAHLGERLTATAHEVSLRGRSGVYDVTINNQDGQKIAVFRGGSRALGRTLFDETTTEGV